MNRGGLIRGSGRSSRTNLQMTEPPSRKDRITFGSSKSIGSAPDTLERDLGAAYGSPVAQGTGKAREL